MPTTGRWMVHAPDRQGASFVRAPGPSSSAPVIESRLRGLDDLRAEVRGLVQKPSGR
jgi:hypothetical protein